MPLTMRLAAALRGNRHLRSLRVLCQDNGNAALLDSRSGIESSEQHRQRTHLGTTQRYMHLRPAALDAAVRLLESSAVLPARGDSGEAANSCSGKLSD